MSDVTSSVTTSITGVTSSVTQGASEVANKATSTLSATLNQLKGGVDSVTEGLISNFSSAFQSVQDTTGSATAAAQQVLSSTQAAVQQAVDVASGQVNAVTGQVGVLNTWTGGAHLPTSWQLMIVLTCGSATRHVKHINVASLVLGHRLSQLSWLVSTLAARYQLLGSIDFTVKMVKGAQLADRISCPCWLSVGWCGRNYTSCHTGNKHPR